MKDQLFTSPGIQITYTISLLALSFFPPPPSLLHRRPPPHSPKEARESKRPPLLRCSKVHIASQRTTPSEGIDRTVGMPRGTRHGRRTSLPWTLVLGALFFLSVILLALLALGIFSLPVTSDNASMLRPSTRLSSHPEKEGRGDRGEQWTEILSWKPRAFLYHNFLSKEECEYLIELAKPHMEKSTVVDSETGKSKDSRVRTSSGMFLRRGQDKVIRAIEKRIADFTFIPIENGEGLQVLHYEVGQKYESHFDYFLDEYNTKNGGQRMATLLMYLSDVEEGGETIFPDSEFNSSSLPYYNELSECGKRGLAVKPKMGDALLFWSMRPDSTLDPRSLHSGCPVIKGNKWSSTKWMHVRQYKAF